MDAQKQKEKTEQSKLTFARNLNRYMEMKGVKTGDVAVREILKSALKNSSNVLLH